MVKRRAILSMCSCRPPCLLVPGTMLISRNHLTRSVRPAWRNLLVPVNKVAFWSRSSQVMLNFHDPRRAITNESAVGGRQTRGSAATSRQDDYSVRRDSSTRVRMTVGHVGPQAPELLAL
jgi:hypothetical protein